MNRRELRRAYAGILPNMLHGDVKTLRDLVLDHRSLVWECGKQTLSRRGELFDILTSTWQSLSNTDLIAELFDGLPEDKVAVLYLLLKRLDQPLHEFSKEITSELAQRSVDEIQRSSPA
jgi:hypothetical protein